MIRISLSIWPEHTDYPGFRAAAAKAEEMGVDVLYTWDHFFPLFGDGNGRHFECFTLLAALAEVTERVPIGPMVACNTYRNPELLADMARTIDHISGGRFILGIGAGWFEKDYDEYGYEFGTAASRLRDLASALPRIEARLAKLNPPSLGRMPILIGGGGEKVTLKLTARHAHIWHGFARSDAMPEVDFVAHKLGVLDGWCAKLGRDPAEIERSIGIAPDRMDLADGIADLGVHEIMLGVDGPKYDMGPLREWLAWRDARNRSA